MLLWLFVIVAGLAVGAGLYEMRINVPRWFRRSGATGIQIDAEARRTGPENGKSVARPPN
jgi:hypothetical protein